MKLDEINSENLHENVNLYNENTFHVPFIAYFCGKL